VYEDIVELINVDKTDAATLVLEMKNLVVEWFFPWISAVVKHMTLHPTWLAT